MRQAQRDAISNPANSLLIYNTSNDCIETFIQGSWKQVACACTAPPAQPGTITGLDTVCPNQAGATYTIASVPNASSYVWSVPAGASITAGQGTNSITVDFATSNGNVSVYATNSCGNSGSAQLAVSVLPADAAFSYNPSTPSIGVPVSFSPSVSNQNYSWSFPSGSPSTSTAQNPSVTWSTPGSYSVQLIASKALGCSDTSTQNIIVTNCITGGSQTFNYTGGMQTFTVPAGVCDVTIQAYGAEGGACNGDLGGQGGYATGDLAVTGGDILYIYVGGQGSNNAQGPGGFNGGGTGGIGDGTGGSGGGGASDVRYNGTNLTDRVIVAAGGGGAGCQAAGGGGDGGGLTGQDGTVGSGGCGSCNNTTQRDLGGSGGTQAGGGAGGTYILSCYTSYNPPKYGTAGSLGQGGGGSLGGGGGGGGYYGGGQGAGCYESSGGGGSSYVGGVTNSSTTQGGRSGNGQVIISW